MCICLGYVPTKKVFAWDAVIGTIPSGYRPSNDVASEFTFNQYHGGILIFQSGGNIVVHNDRTNSIGEYVAVNAAWKLS